MAKQKAVAASADTVASAASVTVEQQPEITPTEEEIAKLAYSLWEARGSNTGSAEDDWFRAEQELKAKAHCGE